MKMSSVTVIILVRRLRFEIPTFSLLFFCPSFAERKEAHDICLEVAKVGVHVVLSCLNHHGWSEAQLNIFVEFCRLCRDGEALPERNSTTCSILEKPVKDYAVRFSLF